jgi:hypothetical protein
MTIDLRPVRRVVTGNDAEGRSMVLYDSAAPNVVRAPSGKASMTDVWVYPTTPAPISGTRDDGALPFSFEPPATGGHLRIVQSAGRAPDYDPATDKAAVPRHPPKRGEGGTWYQGGQNAFSSPYHRSETLDYGIVVAGERVLLLDEGTYTMRKGDVVVQLGNWHGWSNPEGSTMAFVMIGATVVR